MDCMSCEDLLSALRSDLHGPETRAAIQNHLAACERCRQFALLLQDETAVLGKEASERLTNAVLERTSGSVCGRAKAVLPDFVDGRLPSADAEILTIHVRHCPGCASLAETLAELRTVLPDLALRDPGAAFTESALAQTAHSEAGRHSRADRIRAFWIRLARRPRIALEAAYAGTLMFLLFTATPSMPWLDPSTAGVARLSTELGERIDSLSAAIPDIDLESPLAAVRSHIRDAADIAAAREALTRPAAKLVTRAKLQADAAAGRLDQAARSLLSALKNIREDLRSGSTESPS